MRDHDDGASEPGDVGVDLRLGDRVEIAGGLVEQQDPWPRRERARQGQPLALTTRQ